MIDRNDLESLYIRKGLSARSIAEQLRCSEHKVNYWLSKYSIPKRTISDALYRAWNPMGDPFRFNEPRTINDAKLYGLGMGLYWGEGTKKDKSSVRLGNSDPRLIKKFLEFLRKIYAIDEKKLRFGLQIFGDMHKEEALTFWTHSLDIPRKQFFPTVIVTPYRGVGNYRQKTKYGVVTIHFSNRKLRDILCENIETISME